MIRKDIGVLLVEKNLITQEQLDDALQQRKNSGEDLGNILMAKEYISKADFARALAQLLSLPYVEKITDAMADPKLLSSIPLRFLRRHAVMPIILNDTQTLLTANPRDLEPLDDLSMLLKGPTSYAVAKTETILDGINKYYPFETGAEAIAELGAEEEASELEFGAIEEKDLLEMVDDAPIIKLVNQILFQAVKEDASDIHIEPFEKELRVRYRIDGVMYQKILPPKRFQGAIVSRIKIMANLNIAEKRLPQDGRIQIKIGNKPFDIRVSILPSNFGERVVMRLLDKSRGAVDLEKLDLREHDFKVVTRAISQPNGIVLITGPTGSGKTTTLYSILYRLNQPDVTIITVEDPVEYTISGVSQVQVKESIGMTFGAALRSILRQDPDIILIGEIRDHETAQIATQASLTGHLVLSTLHTNSAPAAITRLIDMGIEPFLIASTVTCVVAQRLVRRLCDDCKEAYQPKPELIERLGLSQEDLREITFYRPVGCENCHDTGFRGRFAIFEVMPVTDSIRPLIIDRSDASIIRREAMKQGMHDLLQDGIRRIRKGQTTIDEVLSVAFAQQEEE